MLEKVGFTPIKFKKACCFYSEIVKTYGFES